MLRHSIFYLLLIYLFVPVFVGAAPPSVAVKFVILNPSDSTVDVPVTVTIEAQKSNNQVDTAYQNDVTLVTSGSATGGGLVDIVNGVGTLAINDLMAETVMLSLVDSQSTGLDVSSTREMTFAATGGGGGGGGGTPSFNQQKFWFRDDNGDEVTATGYDAGNTSHSTNITIARGVHFRLRLQIKLAAADGSITARLEFQEGTGCTGDNWTVVTPESENFHLISSSHVDDGVPTTKQLTSPGLSFVAGKILESTNPASLLSMLKNQSTEYEWSLETAKSIPLETTYSFRVTNNGTVLDGYGACPTLRIAESGSGRPFTQINFFGQAFPNAKISVVSREVSYEKVVSQDITIDEEGRFSLNIVASLQSQYSFGILFRDKENRTTQTKFFNIDTSTEYFVEKDILVPPTVGFVERSVTRGRNITVVGYASPGSSVIIEIDGTAQKEATADEDGFYAVEVGTGELEFGPHYARVIQDDMHGKKSDFSSRHTFAVSRFVVPKVDLNGDGTANIKDWSKFLFHWASKDMTQKRVIDFNEDGKVDISDFSIFVKNIRKISK